MKTQSEGLTIKQESESAAGLVIQANDPGSIGDLIQVVDSTGVVRYSFSQTLQGRIAGQAPAGNAPYWLDVAGGYLFCQKSNDRIVSVYDITTNPAVPALVGSTPVTAGTGPAWMKVRGKYLYISDQNDANLRTYDISNPAAIPAVISTVLVDASGNGLQGRFGLQPRGRYGCIGGPAAGANTGKVYVLDFVDPATPAVVGNVALATVVTLRGICPIGSKTFACASRDDHTVRLVDITNPAIPAQVANINALFSNTTTPLASQGHLLFIGNYGNGGNLGGVECWDCSVPATPRFLSGINTGIGGAEQMVVRGPYLYIQCRPRQTLVIVNIRNPAAIRVEQTIQLPVNAAATAPGSSSSTGWRRSTGASAVGGVTERLRRVC
jgi:hypothetical protein